MKIIKLPFLALIFSLTFMSCERETFSSDEANLELETVQKENRQTSNEPVENGKSNRNKACASNTLNPCSLVNYTLVDTDPYTSYKYATGYMSNYGQNLLYCDAPLSRDCLASILRITTEREFAEHNSNIVCGQKGVICPNSTNIEYGNIYFDIEELGINDSGNIITASEANTLYREIMCIILNDENESSVSGNQNYLRVESIRMDRVFCSGDIFINMNYEIHEF